ncbi:hypothetical protein VTO42DRAFT_4345 [Malbranchea cinnamomea]
MASTLPQDQPCRGSPPKSLLIKRIIRGCYRIEILAPSATLRSTACFARLYKKPISRSPLPLPSTLSSLSHLPHLTRRSLYCFSHLLTQPLASLKLSTL